MVLSKTSLFRLIFHCLQFFYFSAKDQKLFVSGEGTCVKIMRKSKKKYTLLKTMLLWKKN